MAPRNITEVTETAVAVGNVGASAAAQVSKAVSMAERDTGIQISELRGDRVFLVNILIDNSGSMRGLERVVREAIAKLTRELTEAAKEAVGCEILIAIHLLHGGMIQPYTRVEDCVELNDDNHVCNGGTPFYTRSSVLLGTLLTKISELAQAGRNAQTFTVFLTDGEATDGPERLDSSSGDDDRLDPNELERLILEMTGTKQNIICGVAVHEDPEDLRAHNTFLAIGIHPNWILDPKKDRFAIDDAIAKVSRASKSASQGAGAFQAMAEGGGFR